jgi:galactonate dehydratase
MSTEEKKGNAMKNEVSRRSFFAGSAAALGFAVSSGSFGRRLEAAVSRSVSYSAPSDLKITDIKCAFVANRMYVKVFTNQDIYGCGEAVDATGNCYNLLKRFGYSLRGGNPLNVNRIFEEIRTAGIFGGAQSGIYITVLSAVETALWDLAGKALGVPVYQLLGGKFRDKIRLYCDTALYSVKNPTPETFAESARDAVKRGFTAIKFDLDEANDPNKYDRYNWTASPGELRRMVDQVTAAREAVGLDIDICCDMHGRYDAVTGEQVAKLMEPLHLMWLEEPIPAENPDAYLAITQSTSTPICAGENVFLAHGFRRMLEIGAIDILMPDLQKAGGLGEGQRIANVAHLYYKPFAPHMVASYLGAMASAHVCAAVPNFLIMEWQIYFHTNKMFSEIVNFEGPMVVDGFLPLTDRPGIGIDINVEAMRKYAAKDIPFFE